MKGEEIPKLQMCVYKELPMPDGGRIVFADPIGASWPNPDLANHNVFRLSPKGDVVWQVRREDAHVVDWNARNRYARRIDPNCETYMDPFRRMSDDFIERKEPNNSQNFDAEKNEVHFENYSPGRILWLTTSRWQYDLDPDSGIARCTGKQVRW